MMMYLGPENSIWLLGMNSLVFGSASLLWTIAGGLGCNFDFTQGTALM
jgi:hypothetical protein